MNDAFICDYIRTPIGRYGGALSRIRADDLAALPIAELIVRNPKMDTNLIEEVWLGCANQAGEDNRNVARMAVLLSGLPTSVPGLTVNRLCGSGMEAIVSAARAIKAGEIELAIAGGVENMSRAPFILAKSEQAFSRATEIYDSTIGWRFVNSIIDKQYGIDSMPMTAENVAKDFNISRSDQDKFALNSQLKTKLAMENGRLSKEILPVTIPQNRGVTFEFIEDEHPRHQTSFEKLQSLKAITISNGTVTAGNASGVNDGAAALIIASAKAIKQNGLTPLARIVGAASVGIEPRIMGYGPVPAIQKLLKQHDISTNDLSVIELNEAFASQSLAVLRALKIDDNDTRVNPNGGAIAVGHPLGMSGARIVGTTALQMKLNSEEYGLAAMCVGVGQGTALLLSGI